jgi:hypothetical protein
MRATRHQFFAPGSFSPRGGLWGWILLKQALGQHLSPRRRGRTPVLTGKIVAEDPLERDSSHARRRVRTPVLTGGIVAEDPLERDSSHAKATGGAPVLTGGIVAEDPLERDSSHAKATGGARPSSRAGS